MVAPAHNKQLFLIVTTVAFLNSPLIIHVRRNSLKRQAGDFLQVVLSTSGDVLSTEENFLGDTTAESHTDAVEHLGCREEVTVGREVLQNEC